MNTLSIGDQGRANRLTRYTAETKAALNRLTDEVASGVVADKGRAVGGDFTPLAGIERALTRLDAHLSVTRETAQRAGAMQAALGQIGDLASTDAPRYREAASTTTPQQLRIASADAEQSFRSAVSALNLGVAGRSLFGGTATDRAPLASADDMLAGLRAAVSGITTATGLRDAVEDWFDTPGGGFASGGYRGSYDAGAPVTVADGETVDLGITAADPAIRDVLKGYALAAMAGDAGFAGGTTAGIAALRLAGSALAAADDGLIEVRARLGSSEARLDRVTARNEAEQSTLKQSRSGLLAVDPYEAATELEATKTQLETLYALTSRLSGMSLLDYLK